MILRLYLNTCNPQLCTHTLPVQQEAGILPVGLLLYQSLVHLGMYHHFKGVCHLLCSWYTTTPFRQVYTNNRRDWYVTCFLLCSWLHLHQQATNLQYKDWYVTCYAAVLRFKSQPISQLPFHLNPPLNHLNPPSSNKHLNPPSDSDIHHNDHNTQ